MIVNNIIDNDNDFFSFLINLIFLCFPGTQFIFMYSALMLFGNPRTFVQCKYVCEKKLF